jgi:hypothetical protein
VDVHHTAYLFAIATGIVSSAAIGSLWALISGEAPHFGLLRDGDFLTPIKMPVVVLSGPTTLMVNACWWLIERPLVGVVMMLTGLSWSFFQGVFILTQLFGVN